MTNNINMEFNCHSCGACCRQAGKIGLPHNGDNVCTYLVDNKCSVYDDRPEICRVKDSHKHFKQLISMDEWYEMNEVSCGSLVADELKQ